MWCHIPEEQKPQADFCHKLTLLYLIVYLTEESLTLSRENQATRGKMEQLRLIMQERRARRRARREARSAPYTLTQWSAKSESLSTQQNPAGGPGSGAGSLGTHGDEPMDTAGSATGEQHVCELNPPEPVVAWPNPTKIASMMKV